MSGIAAMQSTSRILRPGRNGPQFKLDRQTKTQRQACRQANQLTIIVRAVRRVAQIRNNSHTHTHPDTRINFLTTHRHMQPTGKPKFIDSRVDR